MQPALRVVADSGEAEQLFESRVVRAAEICATLRSAFFVECARGLRDLMEPLVLLTSWLGRCMCHEESDAAAKTCVWKGCIGPVLSARIKDAIAALAALRESRAGTASSCAARASASSDGTDVDSDIALSAELAMSDLATKFHWVDEPPYLVWQAGGAGAQRAQLCV